MTTATSTRVPNGRARKVGWVLVVAVGAFLALGSVYDLISTARGQLPSDHVASFVAMTGTRWQDAASASQPMAPYISLAEIDYAVYELLFAALFLAVAAIPLRRGERWAWWCCWLIVVPEATFAMVFGAHDTTNRLVAIGVGAVAILGLVLARPGTAPKRAANGSN